MASIVTKKIKGIEYIYLVESIRHGKKVTQKTIKYIGKKRPIPKEEFECMIYSHKKKDWILESPKEFLSYQDHEKMKKASRDYIKYFNSLDKKSKENERERFLSEFIANSNAIEGSTLTKKDTFNFLFNDITPKNHSKKEIFMANNLLEAWEYVEKNFKRLPNEEDIMNLHKIVNREIEEGKTLGKYKKVQNYIGDVLTTSHLFVKERMKYLLSWIKISFKRINVFETIFQSHAQFEIIHPFVDGNGRVGRLIMNWLLMNKGLRYFAIRFSRRSEYISALENSRRGKIEAICSFCLGEYLSILKFV